MVEMRILSKGDSGEDVKTMQRILKELGFRDQYGKILVVDGDFGKRCDYALKNFQKSRGLTQDGWCGPATWNRLLNG